MKKAVAFCLIFISFATGAMFTPTTRRITPLATLITRTLGTSASSEMTDHIKKLQQEFPDKVLQRYINDHRYCHLQPTIVRDEWIKYALLARKEIRLGMFSKDVDNMWHTFLLFNKDYEAYCSRLDIAGQDTSILYHIPHGEETICPRVCQWAKKQKFVDTYRHAFGTEPNRAVWGGLFPCRPSCDPTFSDTQHVQAILFQREPTFTGAVMWTAAMLAVFGGINDASLAEFLVGCSLGAGRFLYNRIMDDAPNTTDNDNTKSKQRNSCDGGTSSYNSTDYNRKTKKSDNNSPGCDSGNSGGSGSSCGSSCGSCGGCD